MSNPHQPQKIAKCLDVPNTIIDFDITNNRLKACFTEIINEDTPQKLIKYAKDHNLGKIIVSCQDENVKILTKNNFELQGTIKGFFKGVDGHFLTYFTDPKRAVSKNSELEDDILEKCMNKTPRSIDTISGFTIRDADQNDIPDMIKLFKTVFESYPSPVFDPEYLKKVMKKKTMFKIALDGNTIASIASAEMDSENLNAEITDCATYPEYRGAGLLSALIQELEKALKEKGFITAFSLSRALNTGMNMVLRKHGYQYGGRLVNNCHICGEYEDMNIWAKSLT